MTAHLLALALELALGSRLVCSEAHTLPHAERVAVAATVRAHVLRTGWPAWRVMRHGRWYAPALCPLARVEAGHAWAYATGRLGLGPAWTRRVVAFYHRRRDAALADSWERRGLYRLTVSTAHVYWGAE